MSQQRAMAMGGPPPTETGGQYDMTRPQIAFVLNFLIPGLGLVYLGKKWPAILNFGIAIVVPLAASWIWPETYSNWVHYCMLAIAAGSGGVAHALAEGQGENTTSD